MPLVRSRRNKILAGVCGGIADWLGWDPTLVRVLYVVVSVLSVVATVESVVGIGGRVMG